MASPKSTQTNLRLNVACPSKVLFFRAALAEEHRAQIGLWPNHFSRMDSLVEDLLKINFKF